MVGVKAGQITDQGARIYGGGMKSHTASNFVQNLPLTLHAHVPIFCCPCLPLLYQRSIRPSVVSCLGYYSVSPENKT